MPEAVVNLSIASLTIADYSTESISALFSSKATAVDRQTFPNGVLDQCQRAFGILDSRQSLIGFATIRDSGEYYTKMAAALPRIPRETLMSFHKRVGIYDPSHLEGQPDDILRQAMKQIMWIACGGEKGFKGNPNGFEIFARFVVPQFRNLGVGGKLLASVIDKLCSEGIQLIRVLPTDAKRTYRGLSDAQRSKLVIMNRDWFVKKLSF